MSDENHGPGGSRGITVTTVELSIRLSPTPDSTASRPGSAARPSHAPGISERFVAWSSHRRHPVLCFSRANQHRVFAMVVHCPEWRPGTSRAGAAPANTATVALVNALRRDVPYRLDDEPHCHEPILPKASEAKTYVSDWPPKMRCCRKRYLMVLFRQRICVCIGSWLVVTICTPVCDSRLLLHPLDHRSLRSKAMANCRA